MCCNFQLHIMQIFFFSKWWTRMSKKWKKVATTPSPSVTTPLVSRVNVIILMFKKHMWYRTTKLEQKSQTILRKWYYLINILLKRLHNTLMKTFLIIVFSAVIISYYVLIPRGKLKHSLKLQTSDGTCEICR